HPRPDQGAGEPGGGERGRGRHPSRAGTGGGAGGGHRRTHQPAPGSRGARAASLLPIRHWPPEAQGMSRLVGPPRDRGVANQAPLTTELAQRLGRQLVATLLEHHGTSKVRLVVGRDTRLSGPLLEGALVSGALSAGADVYAVGVLPTPGIAYLTRRLE